MEQPRGIGVVLEGMAAARREGLSVELDLIGDGREKQGFEAQARSLGLNGAVKFHGYIPYRDALHVVNKADIGLVPHFANESWNTTIPNKLFDYMAAGLPVLTSTAVPAARLVRSTGSGEVFEDRDPASFLRALKSLASAERRGSCSESGRTAVAEQYHWERDAIRLIAALDGVVAGAA
jgi:glycosyltransferase involved in cell wall biosynthesis